MYVALAAAISGTNCEIRLETEHAEVVLMAKGRHSECRAAGRLSLQCAALEMGYGSAALLMQRLRVRGHVGADIHCR